MALADLTEKLRASRESKERLLAEAEDAWRLQVKLSQGPHDEFLKAWMASLKAEAAVKTAINDEKQALDELIGECARLAGVIGAPATRP